MHYACALYRQVSLQDLTRISTQEDTRTGASPLQRHGTEETLEDERLEGKKRLNETEKATEEAEQAAGLASREATGRYESEIPPQLQRYETCESTLEVDDDRLANERQERKGS